VREDDGGDVLVFEVCVWLIVKKTVRQLAPGGNGDRCELETAVANVANGVDVGERSVLVFIGDNVLQTSRYSQCMLKINCRGR
jgi:hypothetical protein